jgi:hypothetical protein
MKTPPKVQVDTMTAAQLALTQHLCHEPPFQVVRSAWEAFRGEISAEPPITAESWGW